MMDEEFKKKLFILYPEYNRATGHYLRKDGRKHICLNNSRVPDGTLGKRKTISWPKALVEVRDNKRLLDNETVNHDDRDFANDNLDNLIVRDRVDHIKLDAVRVGLTETNCVWCSKVMFYNHRSFNGRAKAGPFCGKVCTGQYGKSIQLGKDKLDRVKIDNAYFTLNKPA